MSDACKKREDDAGHAKAASGIIVFLQEELGDARLRCAQLKRYVKDATDIIEKSEHRDHFFEVAGNLIYGIPDALLKLDKALDATALAAARLDYEEIKNNLRPEKADELEAALNETRLRYLNRRSYEAPQLDKSKVEQWMRHHLEKFVVDKVDTDGLADSACHELDLYDGDDVPGELYTWAAEVAHSTGHEPVHAPGHHHARQRKKPNRSQETPMNAKSAAYFLNKIAELTEKEGRVPVAAVLTLISKLETGSKKASVLKSKAPAAFRNLAKAITGKEHPSRMALADVLRRIVGDTLPGAVEEQQQQQQQQQQQAQVAPLAGAGEQFLKHNPNISPEEKKTIDEMHSKHEDEIKGDKGQQQQQQQ